MKRTGTILLLILAVVLMGIGLCSSQFQVVMAKASKVCLECIGIG